MLTKNDVEQFCSRNNYDLRRSGNGRWIDQKCAADVITVIADCIYNYNLEHPNASFTSKDIWHYKYAIENIEAIFKKAEVESSEARNEYDKFFQQPMEMLANAKVLSKAKIGKTNHYSIINNEVLEYIALREKNSLLFLRIYIEKVLRDSGIWEYFNNFLLVPSKRTYNIVKEKYFQFIIENTKINGVTECNRIFIKVLNPLAYFMNVQGTERGRISKQRITYNMLMYNRDNFRDVYADKPKGITRKEYVTSRHIEMNEAYYKYQSVKAKRFLRIFNDQNRNGKTEYLDGVHTQD
ncbi:MAG: restriction endonuclease [Fusobacteria bacterium]|nr:restriction endonuclease [Fusobacteriota bacterium]